MMKLKPLKGILLKYYANSQRTKSHSVAVAVLDVDILGDCQEQHLQAS